MQLQRWLALLLKLRNQDRLCYQQVADESSDQRHRLICEPAVTAWLQLEPGQ